jgi:hypothetical protein
LNLLKTSVRCHVEIEGLRVTEFFYFGFEGPNVENGYMLFSQKGGKGDSSPIFRSGNHGSIELSRPKFRSGSGNHLYRYLIVTMYLGDPYIDELN